MSNSRISILLDNQAGALARVVTLFRRRSFNIIALSVGETQDKAVSRLTIVSDAREDLVHHVQKQLLKQEYVHAAEILPPQRVISRELLMAKMSARQFTQQVADALHKDYDFRTIERDEESWIVEFSEATEVVEQFIDRLVAVGLLELSRTGETALARGAKTLYKYAVR